MDESGKMSKSKGATLTVSLLKSKGYDPLSFRFMCLQSHYRKQLVFSYENLDNASLAYKKLKNKCLSVVDDGNFIQDDFNKYDEMFKNYLSDDLNTASALSVLYDVLKNNIGGLTKIKLIDSFDKVLSLDLLKKEEKKSHLSDDYIKSKIEERKMAKERKDYASADAIRDELLNEGIKLVDTPNGVVYEIL